MLRFFAVFSTALCGVSAAAPSCATNSAFQRTVGYYDTSQATTGCGKYLSTSALLYSLIGPGLYPESLQPAGYTHLNAAHAYINSSTYEIAFSGYPDSEMWTRLTALREINPGLKIWLSLGGWLMNGPGQPTTFTFSRLVGESAEKQQVFFNNLLGMLGAYSFDGIDIDW